MSALDAAEAAPSVLRSKTLKWRALPDQLSEVAGFPLWLEKPRRDAGTAIAVSFGLPHDQLV